MLLAAPWKPFPVTSIFPPATMMTLEAAMRTRFVGPALGFGPSAVIVPVPLTVTFVAVSVELQPENTSVPLFVSELSVNVALLLVTVLPEAMTASSPFVGTPLSQLPATLHNPLFVAVVVTAFAARGIPANTVMIAAPIAEAHTLVFIQNSSSI